MRYLHTAQAKASLIQNGPQADPCKAEIDHGHQPLQHHQDHHILEQYRVQRVIHLHLLENKKRPSWCCVFMPLGVMYVLEHNSGHPCQDCQGVKASHGPGGPSPRVGRSGRVWASLILGQRCPHTAQGHSCLSLFTYTVCLSCFNEECGNLHKGETLHNYNQAYGEEEPFHPSHPPMHTLMRTRYGLSGARKRI